jgi:tRNA A-37 threonylcarbamoyl transferase component Bud32
MTEPESDNTLRRLLKRHGLDSMGGVMAYEGGTDLAKRGLGDRRRTRLELTDDSGGRRVLFLKRYGPPGILAGIRRRWTHGWTFSPAEVEARNIEAARQAGVPTMQAVDWRSGAAGSYLITTAVPGDALERCPESFWRGLADDAKAGAEFTSRLAALVRTLHAAGCVHRDLYASHIFLDEGSQRSDLYLIDLARMFRPRWRRFRWRVKDLAQLHYSMPPLWTDRWWEAFLGEYLGPTAAASAARWRAAILRKSASIARRAGKSD